MSADDIRQFREALAGALGREGADSLASPDPGWRDRWPVLAGLGATALCTPEVQGGLGRQVEVAVATAAELGAALHGGPYAGVMASSVALAGAGPDVARASATLAGIVSGACVCAFGRLDPATGTARSVDGSPHADALVLEVPGTGDLLLLDDPDSWAVAPPQVGFDVSRVGADVNVDLSRAHRLPHQPDPGQMFGLLLAADALGGTERVHGRTVAYARQRQAFGRAIGGFQAVQHRLADHAVRLRGMTALVTEAARSVGTGSDDAPRRVLLAQASVAAGAGHILHDLLQLTGAIGFTWEYGLHFYERRAHRDAQLTAQPRSAHEALARIEGWTDAR